MMSNYKKQGFTLIELLLSLYIIVICLTLITYGVKAMKKILDYDYYSQDMIAINQLRTYMASKQLIACDDDEIIMQAYDKEIIIKYDKKRIVITPGYQIMMQKVENAYFYELNDRIYFHYERNKAYEVLLYE